MSPIPQNLQAITTSIVAAAAEAGRAPDTVQLLAVSKTFGPQAVQEAVAAGQRAFGENYLQEGVDKIRALQELGAPPLEWHFIGPIQSNKTRPIAENFDWVHTVEREKIAQRLSEQRPA
ncbi:MAG: YggS family pyridoxal phosphate-dependent enzyme, partial [Duganella sp.]